jgi:uncharacterized protein (TIGR03435 family)
MSSMGTPPPPPPQGVAAGWAAPIALPPGHVQKMLQNVLAERFNLKLNRESQNLPVYDLEVADTGAKLTETTSPHVAPNGEPIIGVKTMVQNGKSGVTITNGPISALTDFLSSQLGREVVDKTGLNGHYDMTLQHSSDGDATGSASLDFDKQLANLGLKLEPQQAPVNVFVIDEVERPSGD